MRALALCLLFALCACTMTAASALMTWPDLLGRPRPAPDQSVRYGDDPLQIVDVWLPTGAGPHPVVVMVHGGCWQSEIADRTIMNWIADDLRARGVAVWNIDYRGVDRSGGGYPGTFLDAAAAADTLRDHAGRFKLRTDRIVAVGHSAGGHLALWLAARPGLSSASALHARNPLALGHVVSLGGLPDLALTAQTPKNGCGSEIVDKLIGPATDARPDMFADTSVPRLAPLGTPQTLIDGANDRIIPVAFGADYTKKMRASGDVVRRRLVPRTGHVELIAPDSAAWAVARRRIMAALK